MNELERRLDGMVERLKELRTIFDVAGKEEKRRKLAEETADPGFWNDPESARRVMDELGALGDWIEPLRKLRGRCEDARVLIELAEEEGGDAELEAEKLLESTEDALRGLELRKMLSGKDDERNAIVSIHAGAGGTDSQDWAQMLLRMYLAWAERRGLEVEMMDAQPGEEAGLKSATFLVRGAYAFGHMRAETGVHRLVRLSPFDAAHRRHTSFASVAAYPEIDDSSEIEIRDADLKLDFFRASGPGGQHVNKSSTAVRITHVPTGIVVSCQEERSQFRNRENAMKVLRSKLYAMREQERRKEQEEAHGEKMEIAWGSQIRSYVLHPYQMVKDVRTSVERSDVERVLDGDIDEFIEAYLKQTE
ncbi:MAG: peptide chain release factor 2 [Candidatus Eisenbacteria bacterium]|nr:peptide chain release factor 2 [Candidatus Eisenbacteria bacterium]